MSSAIATPLLPRAAYTGKVTQARVFLSEWTKLRSVRSTRWSLLVAFVATIGIAALATAVLVHKWPNMSQIDRADFHPLEINLAGVQLAQLAIGVLGVLVITAEYSTGMIRASMTAVPKRLPVLWGKAVVYGLTTLVLMVPATLIAFFVGQAILAGGSNVPHLGLGDAGVARAVIGAALYLTVVGLFGLGIGAILRNTAAGIATFAAVMFVLPPLMNVLPSSWNNAASPYLPLAAGQAIMSITPGGHHLAPWTGLGLLAAYTAASLVIAAVLLRRRDS
jgi:ABC-2 type transport system permease protein